MYDAKLGRFLSPDNYIQEPFSTQSFNRYGYVFNNPLKYNDPSGEFAWVPFILSTAFFAGVGAAEAVKNDLPWYQGAFKGALVGAVGGFLGQIGGGNLLSNILLGAGQGAFTGAFNAILWGQDVWDGIKSGAAWGAAFAAVTSGVEAGKNLANGHGFRTNEGVIKKYIGSKSYQKAIDFIQDTFNLKEVKMYYDSSVEDYGVTEPMTGDVKIGPSAFSSSSLLKATMIHEMGHSILDRVLDSSGRFKNWKYEPGKYPSRNQTLSKDGPLGYAQEIYNSGTMKINTSVLKNANLNPLWSEWSKAIGGSRFFHTLPMRFNNRVNLKFY